MSMPRVIKLFCPKREQQRIIKKWALPEKVYIEYPGFLVLHLDPELTDQIAQLYPYEDLTEQFRITVDGQDLHQASSRIVYDGNQMNEESQALIDALEDGAHHYLVQFKGPIKKQ